MALCLRRGVFVGLFIGVLSGCDSQVAPVGGAAPAPQNVPSASNEPGPSGYDFTIWNARKVGHSIDLQYRLDQAANFSQRYRLLVESPNQDTIYSDLRITPGRDAVGVSSTISLSLLLAQLPNGGKDATVRIVKYQGFGLRDEGTPDPASNSIPLEVPASAADSGEGGGKPRFAPPPIDPEHTPPDGIPNSAVQAWHTLQQEFGKAKIVVLRLEGGENVDLVEVVRTQVEQYKKNHDGAKVYEILDEFNPTILIAPSTDMMATAKEFGLGNVTRTDSFAGVAFIAIDAASFRPNDAGIMADEEHPDFFAKNFAVWEKSLSASESKFPRFPRPGDDPGPAIKRLAKAEPANCPEELREKIGQRFESQFNSGERQFADDVRMAVIEGYANWAPDRAGPDMASMLREIARERFRAREEAQCIIEQLGKLQETSAVDTLASAIVQTGERSLDGGLIEPAADALIAIGPASAEAAHKLVRHNNKDICLTGIRILEEVGTKASLSLLGQASSESRDAEVRDAARGAMRAIRMRDAGKQ